MIREIIEAWLHPYRRGIIDSFDISRTFKDGKITHTPVYEVEEVERVGRKSRIRIVRLSGIPILWEDDARTLLPKWVDSDSVKWLEEENITPEEDRDGRD